MKALKHENIRPWMNIIYILVNIGLISILLYNRTSVNESLVLMMIRNLIDYIIN